MYTFETIMANVDRIKGIRYLKSISGGNIQGSCGIVKVEIEEPEEPEEINQNKDDKEQTFARELIFKEKSNTLFYKFGNNGNNTTLVRQEYIVSQHLMETCSHVPHFLRSLVYMKNQVLLDTCREDPLYITKENEHKNKILSDLVMFENLENAISLHQFIKRNKKYLVQNKHIVRSVISQIFLSILVAQQNAQFTHNDLHYENVLIKRCPKNTKLLYKIVLSGKTKYFLVPTHGIIPIIVDYGYAYSSECEGMSLENIDVDNYGFITYQFDSVSDFIRMMVMMYSLKIDEDFNDQVLSLILGLPISLKNSWEKHNISSSNKRSEKIFFSCFDSVFGIQYTKYSDETSKIITQGEETFVEQMHKMCMRNILMPVKYSRRFENLNIFSECTKFLKLWYNVDKWIDKPYQRIYVLRVFTEEVRKVCGFNTKDITDEFLAIISDKVISSFTDSVIQHKNTPTISVDWKEMVVSFINYVGISRNIYYENINTLDKIRKKKIYSRLVSGEHIWSKLEPILISPNNVLRKGDNVIVIDNSKRTSTNIEIQEDVQLSDHPSEKTKVSHIKQHLSFYDFISQLYEPSETYEPSEAYEPSEYKHTK